ncbi:hypothetical protein [Endozoicomonas atrinae]|uniref:hypothetical protein n=1 Tax=Endozoicomonas atrinae TaxID=1333660 RepID=UPI003AFFC1B1
MAKSILNRTVVSVENYEDILARVRTQLSSSGDPFFTDAWGDDEAEEASVTEAADTPKPPSMMQHEIHMKKLSQLRHQAELIEYNLENNNSSNPRLAGYLDRMERIYREIGYIEDLIYSVPDDMKKLSQVEEAINEIESSIEIKPIPPKKPWQALETVDHISCMDSVLTALKYLPISKLKDEDILPEPIANHYSYIIKFVPPEDGKKTPEELVNENPLLQLAIKPGSMEPIHYPRILENLIGYATVFTPEEQKKICLAIDAIKNR